MGWFSKRKQAGEKEDTLTFFLVPKDTVIYGNIESPVPCTVEGYIIGDVSVTGLLTVASTAEISGSVNCDSIMVYGKINRDISCNNKAYVGPGGYVDGKIIAAIVELDDHATVNNNEVIAKDDITFDPVVKAIVTLPKTIANEQTWF